MENEARPNEIAATAKTKDSTREEDMVPHLTSIILQRSEKIVTPTSPSTKREL
jgi:hypothetical protein